MTLLVAFLVRCSAAVFLAHAFDAYRSIENPRVEKAGGFCGFYDRCRGTRYKSATQ